MYPMDFEEFLWAAGNETLMDLIRTCSDRRKPLGQALHRKAMDLFRQYLIIGGMPQVVRAFVESSDFERVDRIKRRILKLYREDICKHAGSYAMKVEAVYDEIPSQLKNQNCHFKLSSLKAGARFDEYKDALFWLSDAMIVNNCYNSTEPNIGLGLNRERRLRIRLAEQTCICYVLHTGDVKEEEGIVYLPLYMAPLL